MGRYAQRHDRALAEGHQGEGRDSQPVPSRHRRCADDPRGRAASRTLHGQQRRPSADAGRQHDVQLRRCRGRRPARNAILRDVRQSRDLPQRMDCGDAPPHALAHDGATPPFDDDVWELYDTTKDWSQAHDLSKEMPDKLHELQRLWLIEATRNNVLADGRSRRRALQFGFRGTPGARSRNLASPRQRHGRA